MRIDSHIYTNFEITTHYDSLIAKIITYGSDRNEALARMRGALEELVIEGVETTTALHQKVLGKNKFRRGIVDINYLERSLNN